MIYIDKLLEILSDKYEVTSSSYYDIASCGDDNNYDETLNRVGEDILVVTKQTPLTIEDTYSIGRGISVTPLHGVMFDILPDMKLNLVVLKGINGFTIHVSPWYTVNNVDMGKYEEVYAEIRRIVGITKLDKKGE